MSVGSDESFLRFYESYARAPVNELQSLPKEPGDFRERIERDTIKGRYGFFHTTIEQYFYRHWRAYTVPRMSLFAFGSFALMQHGVYMFQHTFPNLMAYRSFSAHPNYKLMGPLYSWFYLLRPIMRTYVTIRLTRAVWWMTKRHWEGKDDPHYTWFYDTLYPDLLHDADDMRYINFRYTDQKVTPEPMTGYYPHDYMRYGDFINKKEANQFTNGFVARQ